jgi:flagellin
MSISFQTNIASMMASVNLNNNNSFQTNTIEQLTSGYRINHSGDDAAGLAVANGFAANIAELQQGVLNGNDGVNTLQIIDGGLSNISTMLNRMQTLATESASTTFTGNRATLNQEYQTLIGEINREASNVGLGTGNSTNATNVSVYIGGGSSSTNGSAVGINLTNGLVDAAALGLSGTSVAGTSPVTVGNQANGVIQVGDTETYTINTASGQYTFGLTGQAGDTASSQLAELNTDLGSIGIQASLNAQGQLAFQSPNAFNASISISAGTNVINSSLYNNTVGYTGVASNYTLTEGTSAPLTINLAAGLSDSQAIQSINSQLSTAGITDMQAVASGTAGTFSLQGGQNFTLALGNLAVGTVGASTVAASGGSGALQAINAVTQAVQLLGNVQGTVGAGENDLNYAIGLANSQITNFSAAESGIRDADVATEAANLTKAQVLEQASVAAMAQANSAPQVILSLLKG